MKRLLALLLIFLFLFSAYAASDVKTFEIQGIIPGETSSSQDKIYFFTVRDLSDDSKRPIIENEIIDLGYADELEEGFVKLFRVELLTNSNVTPEIKVDVSQFKKVSLNSAGDYVEEENITLPTEIEYKYGSLLPDGLSVLPDNEIPIENSKIEDFENRPILDGYKIDWTTSGDSFVAKIFKYNNDRAWEAVYYYILDFLRLDYYKFNPEKAWDPGNIGNSLVLYYIDYSARIENPAEGQSYQDGTYKMDVTVTLSGE